MKPRKLFRPSNRDAELRREALEEVRAVYRELESRPVERACLRRTECCQFKLTGRTPQLTRGEAILAAVEVKAGCHLDTEELIAQCKAQLGSVKAPKFVHVVEQLPRSPVGKTLRRAVRAPYWEGRSTLI